MLTWAEMKGWKSLACAILLSALTDARQGENPTRELYFTLSSWCEELCFLAGIAYPAYKREMAQRLGKWLDDAKLRRLKTYQLAEVLKNGKDTRTDKS